MSQERVSNDEFLTRLTTLFSSTHSAAHGSVYLTQKALPSSDPSSQSSPSSSESSEPAQILVRATNGLSKPHRTTTAKTKTKSSNHKIKLATVVDLADLEPFYARYAEVCKKGMEGLRKRDKKKAKEKAKAKKKGKGAATTATGGVAS